MDCYTVEMGYMSTDGKTRTYDTNGNILGLKWSGMTAGNSYDRQDPDRVFGVVDELTYQYER